MEKRTKNSLNELRNLILKNYETKNRPIQMAPRISLKKLDLNSIQFNLNPKI